MGSLVNVKYSSILPDGKTGNYTAKEKIQFTIPPRYAHIDGRQSYLRVEVDATCSQAGADANLNFPCVFPRHVGGSVLFSRVGFNDIPRGLSIENVEGYNTYVGIMKSYSNDTDMYGPQDMTERCGSHTNKPCNRTSQNPALYYFNDMPEIDSGESLIGGNTAITGTCVLPIYLGMWSRMEEDAHEVLPNLEIGGTQLELYTEMNDVVLSSISHGFHVLQNGAIVENNLELTDNVHCTSTNTSEVVIVRSNVCNLSISGTTVRECGYRVGMRVDASQDAAHTVPLTGDAVVTITKIQEVGNFLHITLSEAATNTGDCFLRCIPFTFSYNIRSIELRVLETQASDPQMLRQKLMKGINYKTTSLEKISQASGLLNAVIDLPAVNERALSVYVAPCVQSSLNVSGPSNSRLNPQIPVTQKPSYIWSIKNILIPNREIQVSKNVNEASDTTLYYKQIEMAMRPQFTTRSLNDCAEDPVGQEMDQPFFYPLLLAPKGSSYRLIDSEPQLRIVSEVAPDAQLYYAFTNHVRTLKAEDNQNVVML